MTIVTLLIWIILKNLAISFYGKNNILKVLNLICNKNEIKKLKSNNQHLLVALTLKQLDQRKWQHKLFRTILLLLSHVYCSGL